MLSLVVNGFYYVLCVAPCICSCVNVAFLAELELNVVVSLSYSCSFSLN
jgi:hypothetical protein